MPLIDLSLVTQTLTRLLTMYVRQGRLWGQTDPYTDFMVTGDPADLLGDAMSGTNANKALSVYLYYLEEDGYNKNLPAPPGNSPPVQFQEMGLNLYYLLTAQSNVQDPLQRPYHLEQRLMGYALKAFHDYPSIDANTQIGTGADAYVFPDALRNNGGGDEFRLALHPASLDDLNKVWTGMTTPMRLSAAYQVSVVLLQAEEATVHPLPVLRPEIEVRPFQPIWIQATESDHRFTLPGQTVERLATSPTASVPVGGSFRILGFGFRGVGTHMFLQSPFWSDPSYVEVTDWIIPAYTDQRMELQVASPVSGRDIVPGPYQIYVRKGQDISNFSSVNIAPVIARVDDHGEPLPDIVPVSGPVATPFEIYGGPFGGDDIRNVEVLVGSIRLTNITPPPTETPPTIEPGEFKVPADTTDRVEAVIPASLETGTYPIRIIVNGISTPPARWFEVTE